MGGIGRKIAVAAVLGVMSMGCAASPPLAVAPASVRSALAGAPQWVLSPDTAGGVAGVGIAPKSAGGIQLQRTEALASARDELARQMEIKVKNLFTGFAQTTGIGDQQTLDKVSKNASRQLADQTLAGSKQKDLWVSPDGTLYALVVVDPAVAAQAAKQAARTSLRDEHAVWQQIQAKNALDELDREVDKQMSAVSPE